MKILILDSPVKLPEPSLLPSMNLSEFYSPAVRRFSFLVPRKNHQNFPYSQPSKDFLCITPSRSHQNSLDSPSSLLKHFGITLTTDFVNTPISRHEGFSHPHRSCQGFLISSSGQGFIFPGSSRRFYYKIKVGSDSC